MPQDEIQDPGREPIEDPVHDPDRGCVDAMSEASMEGSDPPAGWAGSDRAPAERRASPLVEEWPRCSVCGNADATAFSVRTHAGQYHVFDSIECAASVLAPTCAHCGCRILGHGIPVDGAPDGPEVYCCTHCARAGGAQQTRDRRVHGE